MSTIEDKLLDGPKVHYCEAGDDDARTGDDIDENHIQTAYNDSSSLFARPDQNTDRLERASNVQWRGTSTNTGPKGVIEDYKKKKTLNNCSDAVDTLEAEFQELLNDDSILKEFISKRISNSATQSLPSFGELYLLHSGSQLLEAIDNENPGVLVLVHLFTRYSRPCKQLNTSLNELATELKHIKFVALDASVTPLSGNFKDNAVPALLAYKGGNLIKSLIQLNELLDKDFEAQQVKELLIDNDLVT